jgi:hypothetical protein
MIAKYFFWNTKEYMQDSKNNSANKIFTLMHNVVQNWIVLITSQASSIVPPQAECEYQDHVFELLYHLQGWCINAQTFC